MSEQDRAAEIEKWIKKLQSRRVEDRRLAVRQLGRYGDADAVEPLITALRDEDAIVRTDATVAFGILGDTRATEPLIVALHDKAASVRTEAVTALGKIGDTHTVELLTAILHDEDAVIRSNAAAALELIKTRKTLAAVAEHKEWVKQLTKLLATADEILWRYQGFIPQEDYSAIIFDMGSAESALETQDAPQGHRLISRILDRLSTLGRVTIMFLAEHLIRTSEDDTYLYELQDRLQLAHAKTDDPGTIEALAKTVSKAINRRLDQAQPYGADSVYDTENFGLILFIESPAASSRIEKERTLADIDNTTPPREEKPASEITSEEAAPEPEDSFGMTMADEAPPAEMEEADEQEAPTD
ncbi:MAG: HEAT repeat domain-containing protein [Anaerolineae bacterium]|nr:HEAT repeat domain-containing protein [Anaerolineae bacterium]